jgi:hypothetical protein
VVIADDFLFTGWDEFSFWALSTKIIYESNALFLSDSPTVFKHYPPAQQLFQYLFLNSIGWAEKYVLYAQGGFVLSCILYISSSIVKKQIIQLVAFYTFCISIYYFNFGYTNIYVDPLLAVLFAACFLSVIKIEKNTIDYFLIFISVSVLILIKEIGLLLSFIIFTVFVTSELFTKEYKTKTHYLFLKKLTPSFIYLIIILITYKSWHIYLGSIGVIKSHAINSPSDFFIGQGLIRLGATATEFISRINNPNFFIIGFNKPIISLSIISVSMVLGIFGILSIALSAVSKSIKETFFPNIIVFVCFFGYTAFLFLTYLVFFSEYEGVRLASLERYISTYILAWTLISFSFFLSQFEKINTYASFFLAVILLGSTIYYSPDQFNIDIGGIKSKPNLVGARIKVEELTDTIKKYIKKEEKAYFIIQNSTGFEKYIFNYAMLPYASSWWCWSLGSKYNDGDVWTCDKKINEVIDGYQFVAVYQADDQFWRDNQKFFDPVARGKVSGVFKVVRDEFNNITLVEVH